MTERLTPSDADNRALAALQSLMSAGRYRDARSALEAMLADGADDPRLLRLLAALADALGDGAQSREAILRYIARVGEDPEALEALGQSWLGSGAPSSAILYFARALRVSPGNPRLLLELGDALLQADRREEAAVIASVLRRQDPHLLALDKDPTATAMFRTASQRLADCLARTEARLLADAAQKARLSHPGCAEPILAQAAIWRPRPDDLGDDPRRPGKLYVPGVPPIPFRDPATIEGLAALAARVEDIREEIAGLRDAGDDYRPYVAAHLAGAADVGTLAGGMGWSALHLYNGGMANSALIERLPVLMAALEGLPLCRLGANPVEIFLSALAPGVRIPPHHGISNHRLTVHLPLIVPEGCGLRVGTETVPVEAGRLLVFDDSFEHEAWNGSDQPRITLIFEIWAPELGSRDKMTISAFLAAMAALEGRAASMLDRLAESEMIP